MSFLEALCMGASVPPAEPLFVLYRSALGMAVKAGAKCDMLNNMAGKRGDTPLMKAAANGNPHMVDLLLRHGARDSHLG